MRRRQACKTGRMQSCYTDLTVQSAPQISTSNAKKNVGNNVLSVTRKNGGGRLTFRPKDEICSWIRSFLSVRPLCIQRGAKNEILLTTPNAADTKNRLGVIQAKRVFIFRALKKARVNGWVLPGLQAYKKPRKITDRAAYIQK